MPRLESTDIGRAHGHGSLSATRTSRRAPSCDAPRRQPLRHLHGRRRSAPLPAPAGTIREATRSRHSCVRLDEQPRPPAKQFGKSRRGFGGALRRATQCYVQMFNQRHRRTGTLWEGRFKSCLVGRDRYVLTVYRYIERNPVRAGMVSRPEEHSWSSVHANLGLRFDSLVTPHPCFLALGADANSRRTAYRDWLHTCEDEEQLRMIRTHLAQQRAYGDCRFQTMAERTLNRAAFGAQRSISFGSSRQRKSLV